MNDLFKLVLSLSISGSIVAVIIFITNFIVKNKFPKSWQYYIWLVLILRLTLPFTIEFNLIGSIFEKTQTLVIEDTVQNEIQFNDINIYKEPTKTYNIQPSNQIEQNQNTDYLELLISNLWVVWIFGMLILLAIKITDYRGFINYIKSEISPVTEDEILEIFDDVFIQLKIRKNINLYKSGIVKSPMLIGIFKPFIIIPQDGIGSNQLRYIFMHELIHFKRLDILYKWIVQILNCIYWFNPIMYFISKNINRLCELSCDELVIKSLDDEQKNTYGNILIDIAQTGTTYKNNVVSTTLCEDKKILKERLKSIMKFKKISKPTLCISIVLIIVIGSMSVISGAVPFKNKDITTQITNEIAANDIDNKYEKSVSEAFENAKTIIDDESAAKFNSVYESDDLIVSEDMNYSSWFTNYKSGKINSDQAGITAKTAHIYGSKTIFDVNIKSDFDITVNFDIKNNSDDFKAVFITPDNKVTTIAKSGNGTKKLQLLKGRNRIKLVGRNDSSVGIDFRFYTSELNRLLDECVDLQSIKSLEPFCDKDTIDKYISNINTIKDLAPYASSNIINKYDDKIENTIGIDSNNVGVNDKYNSVYENDKLISSEDINYTAWYGMYINGRINSEQSGITAKNAHIVGSTTIFDVNIKSNFDITVDFDIKNNSDDFKVVFITPDNKVTIIANSGNGTKKLQLLKGRNRIKLVGRNDSSVGIDFRFYTSELNRLLDECVDLQSLISLDSFCAKDIIDKYITNYIDNNGSDLSQLKTIAPYLKQNTLDTYVKKIVNKSNEIDLDTIKELSFYLSQSTIDFCIQKATENQQDINTDIIKNLAPYASRESISNFVEKSSSNNTSSEVIKYLAPYANRESIGKFIEKATGNNNTDPDTIKYLAPYANRESIGYYMTKVLDNGNINSDIVKILAPYSTREGVSSFIIKYADKDDIDFNLVKYLAPYANRESIDKFIEKTIDKNSIDTNAIRYLAPYASSNLIDKYIEDILNGN